MDDQLDCLLLHDSQLPLHVIWDLVCKLPMADRCALLATCKKALSTFGGLTTRMARLRLTMREKPRRARHAVAVSELLRGDPSHALKILTWFPDAVISKLQLQFIGMRDVAMSASIECFTAGAGARLRHVTSLEMNEFDTPGQEHVRTPDTPTISTNDMYTIATAFPALQHLALSNMLTARRQQLQLQPLSQLTGLRALSLKSDERMPESMMASLACLKGLTRLELTLLGMGYSQTVLPHLKHVSGLASLCFGMGVDYISHGSHLSCLWGLQQLTHLSFGMQRRAIYDPHISVVPQLAGCKQLVSLELPCAILRREWAELLASTMPQLMQLTVHGFDSQGPIRAPCGLKELTLHGGSVDLKASWVSPWRDWSGCTSWIIR